MRWLRKFAISFFLGTSLCFPAAASSLTQDIPADRSTRLAESYAATHNVSVEEAGRRLARQSEIGALQERIAANEGDTFAGLYIEHDPQFRVVVKFTRDSAAILSRYTSDPTFVADFGAVSYQRLVDAQQSIHQTLRTLGIDAGSVIDIVSGRIRLYVSDPTILRTPAVTRVLRLPAFTDVGRALDLSPERESSIEGGRPLSNGHCTTGFTVASGSQRFILTAGHCGNGMTFNGVTLPVIGRNYAIHSVNDYQWHSTPGFTRPSNRIYDGIDANYPINGARTYESLVVGEWVEKYGAATGWRSGRIVNRNYNFLGAGGFVEVAHPQGQNMSSGGDSGGPYYTNAQAFGIHVDSARLTNPNNAVFMPVSRISVSSLSVVTTP